MKNFNYEKAYFTQAKPAFENLSEKQKEAHRKTALRVKDLQQGRNLNIPISPEIHQIFDRLSCREIAELARASYFVGHWQPSGVTSLFENESGQAWKVSDVCDQILRERIATPYNILIHQGKLRVTFSNRDCWLWEEFSLATEENLRTFENCDLPFGGTTLENSANSLKAVINDLWSDVDTMPNNEDYQRFSGIK